MEIKTIKKITDSIFDSVIFVLCLVVADVITLNSYSIESTIEWLPIVLIVIKGIVDKLYDETYNGKSPLKRTNSSDNQSGVNTKQFKRVGKILSSLIIIMSIVSVLSYWLYPDSQLIEQINRWIIVGILISSVIVSIIIKKSE